VNASQGPDLALSMFSLGLHLEVGLDFGHVIRKECCYTSHPASPWLYSWGVLGVACSTRADVSLKNLQSGYTSFDTDS
jgi:hypothetical protein